MSEYQMVRILPQKFANALCGRSMRNDRPAVARKSVAGGALARSSLARKVLQRSDAG